MTSLPVILFEVTGVYTHADVDFDRTIPMRPVVTSYVVACRYVSD